MKSYWSSVCYQRAGVWTQSLETYRNAEHYMYALEWSDRLPGIAQASLLVATPAYSAYKGLFGSPPKDTPPSWAEFRAGYMGISDSLNLLPGGNLDFTNGVSPTAPMEPFQDRRNGASR